MTKRIHSLAVVALFLCSTAIAESQCELMCGSYNEEKTMGKCEIWGWKDHGYALVFKDLPNPTSKQKLEQNRIAACAGNGFYLVEFHGSNPKGFGACDPHRDPANGPACIQAKNEDSVTLKKSAKKVFPK